MQEQVVVYIIYTCRSTALMLAVIITHLEYMFGLRIRGVGGVTNVKSTVIKLLLVHVTGRKDWLAIHQVSITYQALWTNLMSVIHVHCTCTMYIK